MNKNAFATGKEAKDAHQRTELRNFDAFNDTKPVPELCVIDRLIDVVHVKEQCEAPNVVMFIVQGIDSVKYVCMNALPQEVQRVVNAALVLDKVQYVNNLKVAVDKLSIEVNKLVSE